MRTIKITEEQERQLRHIAMGLNIRGLSGAELIDNLLSDQKRYRLVLTRQATEEYECIFTAENDALAEVKAGEYASSADQFDWQRSPGAPLSPRIAMLSELPTRKEPEISSLDVFLDQLHDGTRVTEHAALIQRFLEQTEGEE